MNPTRNPNYSLRTIQSIIQVNDLVKHIPEQDRKSFYDAINNVKHQIDNDDYPDATLFDIYYSDYIDSNPDEEEPSEIVQEILYLLNGFCNLYRQKSGMMDTKFNSKTIYNQFAANLSYLTDERKKEYIHTQYMTLKEIDLTYIQQLLITNKEEFNKEVEIKSFPVSRRIVTHTAIDFNNYIVRLVHKMDDFKNLITAMEYKRTEKTFKGEIASNNVRFYVLNRLRHAGILNENAMDFIMNNMNFKKFVLNDYLREHKLDMCKKVQIYYNNLTEDPAEITKEFLHSFMANNTDNATLNVIHLTIKHYENSIHNYNDAKKIELMVYTPHIRIGAKSHLKKEIDRVLFCDAIVNGYAINTKLISFVVEEYGNSEHPVLKNSGLTGKKVSDRGKRKYTLPNAELEFLNEFKA